MAMLWLLERAYSTHMSSAVQCRPHPAHGFPSCSPPPQGSRLAKEACHSMSRGSDQLSMQCSTAMPQAGQGRDVSWLLGRLGASHIASAVRETGRPARGRVVRRSRRIVFLRSCTTMFCFVLSSHACAAVCAGAPDDAGARGSSGEMRRSDAAGTSGFESCWLRHRTNSRFCGIARRIVGCTLPVRVRDHGC